MKKVLSLAILATLVSNPAFAGNPSVSSRWQFNRNRTENNYNIDSTTNSTLSQEYSSESNTMFFEGKVKTELKEDGYRESFENFTIHNAGSSQNGSFHEENTTRVWGTINSVNNSYTNTSESSAGIR
jgi:dipeptidase